VRLAVVVERRHDVFLPIFPRVREIPGEDIVPACSSLTIKRLVTGCMSGGLARCARFRRRTLLVGIEQLTSRFGIREINVGSMPIGWEPASPSQLFPIQDHVDDVNIFRFPT